jgi:hypothetical protein
MIFINGLITMVASMGILWIAVFSYCIGVCFLHDVCEGWLFNTIAVLYSLLTIAFVVITFIAIFAKIWGYA